MIYYPIMINMEGKRAVVIGAGEVALRKVHDLLEGGAAVTVVAPSIIEAIRGLGKRFPGLLEIRERPYQSGDLDGARLVYSATNDPAVNHAVFTDAENCGVFINAVDDPENSSFIVPSSFRCDDLVVAVSTSGASPSLAARIRRTLEDALPADIGNQLASLREARRLLKNDPAHAGLTSADRGKLLKDIVNDQTLLDGLAAAWSEGRLQSFLLTLMSAEGKGRVPESRS